MFRTLHLSLLESIDCAHKNTIPNKNNYRKGKKRNDSEN